MAADPSVVVEIDIEQNVFRVYNPLFPDMNVTADRELIQDFKALTAPGHYDGTDTWEVLLGRYLREEYKAKYGV